MVEGFEMHIPMKLLYKQKALEYLGVSIVCIEHILLCLNNLHIIKLQECDENFKTVNLL